MKTFKLTKENFWLRKEDGSDPDLRIQFGSGSMQMHEIGSDSLIINSITKSAWLQCVGSGSTLSEASWSVGWAEIAYRYRFFKIKKSFFTSRIQMEIKADLDPHYNEYCSETLTHWQCWIRTTFVRIRLRGPDPWYKEFLNSIFSFFLKLFFQNLFC